MSPLQWLDQNFLGHEKTWLEAGGMEFEAFPLDSAVCSYSALTHKGKK